ncbi:MAG: hypothetical protein WDW38_010697 [Sanguina aurantia]
MADDEEPAPTPVWDGKFSEEGLPHGKGNMAYPPPPLGEGETEELPGDAFEGEMVQGSREGQGSYTWGASGARYTGSYRNNRKHGAGSMKMPDTGLYTGGFVEDVMEGDGLYQYGNGDMYEGGFKAGKRSGRGTYHYKAPGCQLMGEWREGSIVSGTWVYRDGSMFVGNFTTPDTPPPPPPPPKAVVKKPADDDDPPRKPRPPKPAAAPLTVPVSGSYFISTTKLQQPGNFVRGVWFPTSDPVVGKATIPFQSAPRPIQTPVADPRVQEPDAAAAAAPHVPEPSAAPATVQA